MCPKATPRLVTLKPKTRKQILHTGVDNLPASSTALHEVAPMQHRGCALVACTGVGAAQQAAVALHKASFRGEHTLIAAPTSKIPPNWDETLYGASPSSAASAPDSTDQEGMHALAVSLHTSSGAGTAGMHGTPLKTSSKRLHGTQESLLNLCGAKRPQREAVCSSFLPCFARHLHTQTAHPHACAIYIGAGL